ncbi:MAG: sugar phosphate isomerase/epimerase [Canidatus Methanoxibalbensis ujae]|nr:sugar phosphate isomerase/epimerase [Candidatus Methanoxibalbensis ujae]MCW7077577.1 sugar phosphate isomerase/epimerase [Candidatus Methanoxibalbensis ujae]
MRVGVSSCIVRELGGGPLSIDDVDIVELSAEDIPLFHRDGSINHEMLRSLDSFDVAFSLHVPNSNATLREIRINLAKKLRRNIEVVERCLEIASSLDIKHVVVHGGAASQSLRDYRIAFLNTLENLAYIADLARDHQVLLCVENLCDDCVGCIPAELLAIIQMTGVCATVDTGHALITSVKYGFDPEDFFYTLAPFVQHVHLHSNNGLKDEHLPIYEGILDIKSVMNAICHVRPANVILEIRRFSRYEDVIKSLNTVRQCVFVF